MLAALIAAAEAPALACDSALAEIVPPELMGSDLARQPCPRAAETQRAWQVRTEAARRAEAERIAAERREAARP